MKEQVCSLQQMEKQLFKLNERVIDYSDLVQSYVIFPLLKNQGFYLRYKNYIYLNKKRKVSNLDKVALLLLFLL